MFFCKFNSTRIGRGHDHTWTMYFDGVHFRTGVSVGIVFVSPKYIPILFSYRLELDCTNYNIVEYETLCLGLYLALDMKIKCLKVIGYFYLIVYKIKKVFITKNEILIRYRNTILNNVELLMNLKLKQFQEKKMFLLMHW